MKLRLGLAALCLFAPLAVYAATPSSSHVQAAEELLHTMKMDTLMDQNIDTVVKAQVAQTPKLAKVEDVFRQFLVKYMRWEVLKPQMVTLYTDTFTEAELRDLNAFYKTPTGQKSITVMPELFQKGMAIGQKAVKEHVGELQEAVDKKLKEQEGKKE
jgi:uncharacterized protein